MSAIMDGHVEQINNKLISKEEYTRCRLEHLDLYFAPRTIERGTARIQAQQVFGPSFTPLSLEEIHEREEHQNLKPSDPIDFHNGNHPVHNITYTMAYYENFRAWMFQRITNVNRVSAEANIVFHRRGNVLLATMDILKRELGANIRPLLPLPLIAPSDEAPKVRPYAAEYLPLTAIKRFVLSAAEMKQVLPDVHKEAHLSLSWKYAAIGQSDTSTPGSSSDDSAGPILGESAPKESSGLAAPLLATENTRRTPEREESANACEALEVAPASTSESTSGFTGEAEAASTSGSTAEAASVSTASAGPTSERTTPHGASSLDTSEPTTASTRKTLKRKVSTQIHEASANISSPASNSIRMTVRSKASADILKVLEAVTASTSESATDTASPVTAVAGPSQETTFTDVRKALEAPPASTSGSATSTVSLAAATAGPSQETAFRASPNVAISRPAVASKRKIKTRSSTTNKPSPASHANKASEAGHSTATPLSQKVLDIITGHALPATKAEAEHSARERRKLLLLSAQRLPKPSKRLSLSTPKAEAHPLFPEFARDDRGTGEILCVCGRDNEEDFEGEWMACDTCGIWQHVECMGEGVPLDRKQRYECQQCDPLRHRGLLARLRRENPVPQEVMPVVA